MTTETARTMPIDEAPPKTNELRRFLKVFLGRKIVMFFGFILVAMVFVAIFADFIAPYDPYNQDLRNALQQPSAAHWLGTDNLGRDVLSRVIYGTRVSLLVGMVSVTIAVVAGVLLGIISGYFGGLIDTVISRIIDALLAFPGIILALSIGAVLGAGMWTVIVALAIALTPTFARLMRGQVLTVKEADYIKASEVIGASNFRIMLKHVLPNCLSPIIVLVTLNLGVAILAEASLSFLGIGITPPQAAWGAMVSEGQRYLVNNPILSFAPGGCVLLVVLAFNIVGDALRDALDPRLRGSI
ncbi:ABC transporter permease [Halalkalibacter krulwichiae]|uniref:Glutathione transport system permease protein GsiD n=1 Tax=Halalkalibacter krulwichiae TaxID=199441 RepID=A0A1X9M8Z1_9BACI|nr:ABC transporter permease [Halalkalibacter krulwichiae]ARK29929.1 Glutathione transport system permease protein GsiD [Halalkalibacter krulwichiae]